MSRVTGRLTVFFEEPFWVGIFERVEKGKLSAAKVTFGAEPREQEVYAFIQKHYDELRFSPGVRAAGKEQKKNPKDVYKRQIYCCRFRCANSASVKTSSPMI